ncbi:MAG: hypothetical protein M0P77_02435 [Firmicutes bacterium]|nr:hypothetical protein [Bacillota bacterium]
MDYRRNYNEEICYDVDDLKSKLEEEMPGVNLDGISQENVKNILMNEIDNNPNISDSIKEKINKGDMEGLKKELIEHLGQSGNTGDSEKIKNMLQNNDYGGLQNELMGMLFKGLTGQKKNDIKYLTEKKAEDSSSKANPFGGIFDETFLNVFANKFNDGNNNDNRIVLLNSIKPFISDGRQKVVDECIKAVNLLAMIEKLGLKVGK